MAAIPELHDPLSDGVVGLRLAAERDIPEVLIAYQDDPKLHLRLGEERPPSGAELGRRCEEAEAQRLAGRGLTLAVLRAGSDDCVGEIRLHGIEWMHARAELGMWLAPQVRGAGLAPRVLLLACRWLFSDARLQRLQLLTETVNEPMLAAAAAAGFIREGVLRAYTLERGARIDCVVLSLLPSDLAQ